MTYLHDDSELLHRMVNKQFKMIGLDKKLKDFQKTSHVVEKKKRWWEIYSFKDEEQYKEWIDWCYLEMDEEMGKRLEAYEFLREMNYLDLVYGLPIKINKEDYGNTNKI